MTLRTDTSLLRVASLLALVAVACLWLLLSTGCASATGSRMTWWNPATWVARAAPAKADRAEERREAAAAQAGQAEAATVHAAHIEVAKADLALAAAPTSPPVALARRTTGNALGLLDQVRPLTAAESAEVRALVADLLSDKAETVAAAEARQREAEGRALEVAAELTAARAKLEQREAALTAANENLREAYDRENRLANQVRNFWAVAGLLALLWLAGNLLPIVARFVPALAPVATAANLVAAPALAYAEQRARDGLAKVGHAMASVRARLPSVAEEVVHIFDQETDRDHQRAIGAAAATAPRGP